MADKSVLQEIVGWLGEVLEYTRDTLNDDAMRAALIADLGGDPAAAPNPPQFPPTGLESVKAYRGAAKPDLEALFSAIQDIRAVIDSLRSFVESLDLGAGAVLDETLRVLLDLMALNYIRLRQPRLYFILQAVSFGEEFASVYGGEFIGISSVSQALGKLWDLVTSPSRWLDEIESVGKEVLDHGADTALLAVAALASFRVRIPADDVLHGWDLVPGVPGSDEPTAGDRVLARTLTLQFAPSDENDTPSSPPATQESALLATVAMLPRKHGGPGFFVSLGGGYEVDTVVSEPWYLGFEMHAAGALSVLVSTKRFQLNPPDDGSDFRVGMAFEARPDPITHKALDFSLVKGTGVAIGRLHFGVALSKQEAVLKTAVRGGVLSIGPQLLDGFLEHLIPSDGLRFPFDFAVGLGSERGLFLEGEVPSLDSRPSPTLASATDPSAAGDERVTPPPLPPLPKAGATGPGVSVRLPIGKSLGPVTVHDLQVRVAQEGSADDRTYLAEAASALSTKLGPVVARADRIGVRLAVKLPEDPAKANMGLFDLDVGVRSPDGIGLAVDAKGVVTGGGFLFHDRKQELYAGVMQLTVKEEITVKAFGLIATRLPDGRKGFSLLVFITAEDFRPVPLGMGFSLLGLGGMIGIHRTFSEDAMREGLKNKTLGKLLFPKDPIRNAPEILRSLAVTFPAKRGGYLLGLLAKIGWSSPTLVLFDLGLILEFGSRTRLIVLGRITSTLPSPKKDLVRLNLDAMGIIDFDDGTVKIDAVLVDSRLVHKFVLTGGMALRACFRSGPGAGFVLAVGGLNPRFAPPTGMPRLDRVTIALASGDNPRLTCAAYFAITSNTLQFGARAQLYAAAHGFNIQGDVGFDVLIQLVPFHFLADFLASVQLKRGSRNLFKVSVEGALEGPRPLRVSGKASFEIFWCDFSVRFDKTLVGGEKPPLPPAVDVLAELRSALADAQNWKTQRAANRQHGVTLRKLAPGDTLVLDPLGNLMVKQQVVPLNTARDIDVFGGAPVAGARRFELSATLNGQPQELARVKDSFAPAQYFSMSDDEKLASPSFEDMDAGLVFGSDEVVFDASQNVAAPLEYKSIVIDTEDSSSEPQTGRYVLTAERLLEQTRLSAAAQAPIRNAGMARFRDIEAPKAATLHAQRWAITSVEDTKKMAPTATESRTWAETQAAMTALNRDEPDRRTRWQLVPLHEVAE